MALDKWSALGTLTTYLSTELNSLASAANKLGAAIANQTNKDKLAILELVVTFGTAPAAGKSVDLYAVFSADGTNYSDGDDTVDPPVTSYLCSFPLRAVTTAQRIVVPNVPLLAPASVKLLLLNESGQAMAATGNTLKYATYNSEIA